MMRLMSFLYRLRQYCPNHTHRANSMYIIRGNRHSDLHVGSQICWWPHCGRIYSNHPWDGEKAVENNGSQTCGNQVHCSDICVHDIVYNNRSNNAGVLGGLYVC